MITNLFSIFACDYESSPWTTYTLSGLTCWDGIHFLYVGCALLGIIVYYPMSTFMYPNLQFQNKMLDLKFYPTFLIVMSQIMLFVSGLGCFYKTEPSVVLCFLAISMLVMGLVCLKIQPCLVKRANLWFAVKYLLTGWVSAGGAIMSLTKLESLSIAFISVGSAAIIVVAYVAHRLMYRANGPFVCFNLCCVERVPVVRKNRVRERV